MPAPARAQASASSAKAAAPAAVTSRRASAPRAAQTQPAAMSPGAEVKPLLATSPGSPLPAAIQDTLERSYQADLSAVRVHQDAAANQAAQNLKARAFTYGPHIFLGPGEQATDLKLMAHEAAHVVQQQAAPIIQRFSQHQDGGFEHEARQAASAVVGQQPFSVQARTSAPGVQREEKSIFGRIGSAIGGAVSAVGDAAKQLGLDKALNYVADKANLIPGFRMFTLILGVNPINMSKVERSAANILRALVEFMPGGGLISTALDNYGIFDKVGTWIEQQIQTLGLTASAIKKSITDFLNSLELKDLGDLGGMWERAKRIFTEPIERLINFAKSVASGVIKFIKDAILLPLVKLAEKTRGWDLLIAVLGKNPVTGDAVPRTAETLIGGFMKLIGQEEVWNNVKKANAIPRVWAWFQSALDGLLGFVRQIPMLAMNAFKALEIADMILVPRAFMKVAAVFGDFIGNFIKWAGNAVWTLLQIIFEVVAPAVMPYIKKAQAAFRTILKDPIGFVGNLVRAGKKGFELFADNFLEHLKAALIKWLTGPLGEAGVYIPKSFDLLEIVKLVLSVLGLTWQNIRTKLLKIIPEPVLVGLEKTALVLVTLVKDGPAAAWEQIKTELTELKDQLIAQVTQMVTTEIVKAAVIKVVSMLNPAGAIIQAILAIYDTVMFFVEKINQIATVVAAFIDSISAIAAGQIDNAAKKVEQTMANGLTVVVAFLAKFARLGGIPDKLVGVIKKIRQPIDKGLDKIVDWLGKMLQKLVGAAKAAFSWAFAKATFSETGGKNHSIYIEGDDDPRLMIASDPKAAEAFLDWYLNENSALKTKKSDLIKQIRDHIKKAKVVAKDIASLKKKSDAWKSRQKDMLQINVDLSGALSKLVGNDSDIGKAAEKYKLEGMTGTYGSIPKPSGDDLTADHQPQAAVLVAAAKFKFFDDDGTLQERAESRAHQGYAINLQKARHAAGATYGYKGKETKESFLARAKSDVKGKPKAQQQRAVIALLKTELRRDVAAIKSVVKAKHDAPIWKDVMDMAGDATAGKKLVDEIRSRIISGEDQVANQDLDSLAD